MQALYNIDAHFLWAGKDREDHLRAVTKNKKAVAHSDKKY